MVQKKAGNSQAASRPLILVPTDFTDVCDNAVNHGAEMARIMGANICLLHVVGIGTTDAGRTSMLTVAEANSKLEACKASLQSGLAGSTRVMVKEGSILKEIRNVAMTLKASLLVMGTHGKQGLQHLFGSYAMKVVVDAPCPVLVVQRKPFGQGFRNIVLPLTSELEARHALNWVLTVSRAGASKVHLLQAGEAYSDLKKRLDLITHQIITVFTEHQIPCEVTVAERTADFPGQVISFAGSVQSDLIMMMMMPDVDIPGFNFLAWDERMIFNNEQIPILCISPS